MTVEQVLEEIRSLLARRRVTQRDLERQFGWGHSYLSSVLAGRTELKVSTLFKVLDALDVSPSVFLAGIEGVDAPRRSAESDRLVQAEQLDSLFDLLQQAGRVAEGLSRKGDALPLATGRGRG